MIPSLVLMGVSVMSALPQGYAIECRSWPGNQQATVNVKVHLVAQDGSKFTCELGCGKTATVEAVRVVFWAALKDSDWPVRMGENDEVIVFGPKGQSLKSIKFESAVWVPTYRPVIGK